MTRVTGITGYWFGLCRKPPVFRASQAGIVYLPEPALLGSPDGGAGRPGTIRRGIGAALSGTKTLIHNPQLLWFSLLIGLVLAGNAIGHGALRYINRIMQPDIIGFYVQDFLLGFATLFCLVFLLAGLVLSIPSKKDRSVSFFEGISAAKKFSKPIFLWSFVLALAGMLLIRIYFILTIAWFPQELGFLSISGPFPLIAGTITQFPFNWTLDWAMLTEIPGYGGRSLLLLIYPFGFMETLDFLAITLLLFILTPFVIPHIVLEQKTLREAVAGSFAMTRKSWAAAGACTFFLGVIVSGVFLSYRLLQAASGMVSPYETVIFHPPGTWIALALLYILVLLTVAFVAATVGGIASLDLYRIAKTGQKPGFPEP
jgi:hypothetical protein